jgi:hypothetical protein
MVKQRRRLEDSSSNVWARVVLCVCARTNVYDDAPLADPTTKKRFFYSSPMSVQSTAPTPGRGSMDDPMGELVLPQPARSIFLGTHHDEFLLLLSIQVQQGKESKRACIIKCEQV